MSTNSQNAGLAVAMLMYLHQGHAQSQPMMIEQLAEVYFVQYIDSRASVREDFNPSVYSADMKIFNIVPPATPTNVEKYIQQKISNNDIDDSTQGISKNILNTSVDANLARQEDIQKIRKKRMATEEYTQVGKNGRIFAMYIDEQNQLIAAGLSFKCGLEHMNVRRFSPSGTLDEKFATHGQLNIDLNAKPFHNRAYAVSPGNDNTIIVGGYSFPGINFNCQGFVYADSTIFRLDSEGALDEAFANNGAFVHDLTGRFHQDRIRTLIVDRSGGVFAGGWVADDNNFDICAVHPDFSYSQFSALIHTFSNGTIDSVFSAPEELMHTTDRVMDIKQTDTGKILSACIDFNPRRTVLFQLDSVNGELDNNFGNNGSVALDGSGGDAFIALAQNGKILFASNSVNEISIIRLHSNGTIDSSFEARTSVVLNVQNTIFGIAVDSNERTILLEGNIDFPTENKYFVVRRLLLNGTLDTTFGENGEFTIDLPGAPDGIIDTPLAVDLKGNTYIGSFTEISGQRKPIIIKLDNNGVFQPCYGRSVPTLIMAPALVVENGIHLSVQIYTEPELRWPVINLELKNDTVEESNQWANDSFFDFSDLMPDSQYRLTLFYCDEEIIYHEFHTPTLSSGEAPFLLIGVVTTVAIITVIATVAISSAIIYIQYNKHKSGSHNIEIPLNNVRSSPVVDRHL